MEVKRCTSATEEEKEEREGYTTQKEGKKGGITVPRREATGPLVHLTTKLAEKNSFLKYQILCTKRRGWRMGGTEGTNWQVKKTRENKLFKTSMRKRHLLPGTSRKGRRGRPSSLCGGGGKEKVPKK